MIRRSRTAFMGLALLIATGAVVFLWSRPPSVPRGPEDRSWAGPVEPAVTLAPNLYLVAGGGCNSVVFVTANGVLIVDTKYKEGLPGLLREIRAITDKPITHVVNTHSHSDHLEGNAFLTDVKVIVHRRTAERLARGLSENPGGHPWAGAELVTVDDRLTLFEGSEAVDLYHFGPAHTDGDVMVVFRAAGVMHAGDMFPDKVAPIIVVGGGGNGATFAGAIENAIATIPNVTRVVTGHGPVVPWSDLVRFGEFNRLLLDHVRQTMKFGTDKDKAFKSLKVPDTFKDFKLDRTFDTMDEIDRSLRPWWKRVWS